MAHDITPASTSAAVRAFVLGFIHTVADGSARLDESAMLTWLSEQFSYNLGTASYETQIGKDAQAQAIVARLASIVNREYWQTDPAYPRPGANTNNDVAQQLLALKNQLGNEVVALEAPYRTYRAGFNERCKRLFYSLVVPGFPPGVAAPQTTCVYVETYVTDWGEESAPSPASELTTVDSNDSRTVTGTAAPSGRNITLRRLYRSASGTASSAFKLQGEYPAAQTEMVDDKTDAQLNDVCATFGWLEPPADLFGLIGMPNGMMLGYVGRTVYACEPYHPYAWPAKYDKPLLHNITGLVPVGQSTFVGTTGRPYLLTGADAASLSEELISSKVPCVSGRSMVAIGNSVFYAAPDGLALYENGAVSIVTKQAIDADKWDSYRPSSMIAVEYDGMYIAFFTRFDDSAGALLFDYQSRAIVELDQRGHAVYSDASGVYVVNTGVLYDLFPAAASNRTALWKSKTFRLNRPQSFGWVQADSTFDNGGAVPVLVRIYADGALHHTATLTSASPARVPPGKALEWRVEVESAADTSGVTLATLTEELKAVP